MQDVCDKLLQQFVACIEGQFAEPDGARAGATPGGCRRRAPIAPPAPDAAVRRVVRRLRVRPAAGGAGRRVRRGGHRRPGPAAPRPLRPAPRRPDDSIDLGATVLPVLVKNYAPYAVAALAGLVLGWLIGRRNS